MTRYQQLSQVVLLLGLLSVAEAVTTGNDFDKFIGWKGEAYQPNLLWKPTEKRGGGRSREWVELISWSPRAFVYHNLLSHEECDHIVATAAPTMKRSSVHGPDGPEIHSRRSSHGTFLMRNQDRLVSNITERVAEWLGVPGIHHEDMQVLRYGPGEEYYTHKDVEGQVNEWPGGKPDGNPRIATVILYLSDVESGGETSFPGSTWTDPPQQVQEQEWSECAAGHVAVKPRKGDALVFFSLWPNGYFDKHSYHRGCPVLKGVKWTATLWVHANPWRVHTFNRPVVQDIRDPGICEDYSRLCSDWARKGLCKTNKALMVGTAIAGGSQGRCRRTCKTCERCAPDDKECYMRNREKLGYLTTPEIWDALQKSN